MAGAQRDTPVSGAVTPGGRVDSPGGWGPSNQLVTDGRCPWQGAPDPLGQALSDGWLGGQGLPGLWRWIQNGL